MSEKLDGVRAYWDGKQLISRQGNPFNPPDYFLKNFPPFAIDGELFSERGKFEDISGIIRSSEPKGWYQLKLHVFDVPNAAGNLFERLATLENYLREHPTPYIQIISQIPIQDQAHLQQFYQAILNQGGEGVVVRNPNAHYKSALSLLIIKEKANTPIVLVQLPVKIIADVFELVLALKIKNEKTHLRLVVKSLTDIVV